ncbi:MAG: hypothetical protein ACM65M_01415 [Microcoleus sp.]
MNTFIGELFVRLKGDRFWEVKGKVAIAITVSREFWVIADSKIFMSIVRSQQSIG